MKTMIRLITVLATLTIGGAASAIDQADDQRGAGAAPSEKRPAQDRGERESRRTEIFPGSPDIPVGVTVLRDVVYGSPGGRDLHLDAIMRKELPKAPRPAIVFIHGGSWKFGNKSQFRRQAAWLADRLDIFGACVEYRLSGESQFPAALQDAKCAVRWVRSVAQKYRIDPERIAVCGGSAGGHLSSMMAVTNGIAEYEGNGGHADFSSDVQLAILYNGEFDMWDLVEKKSLIDAMKAFFGGTPEEVPERYDEASSIKRVTKDTPPMLFLHGDQDRCVSHEQALAMVKRLCELNVPAEAEIYEGKPHAWFNKDPDWKITVQRVEPFLVEHFKLSTEGALDREKD
ncbi:MAG: alpha/beta hydrolase [Planctomycetes bacterium]|nr:alpha/beta hydrolase [Planctomycetota bacterium]MBL7042252.1 alpha/beta hydrolase [Pirellulaceae bacterium]